MLRRTAVILVLLALALSVPSCTRAPVSGDFRRQALMNTVLIPAEWGNLVSASTSTEYPDLTQLWFQDGDGNIRMVVFHLRLNRLVNVTLFPRK